MNLRRAVLVLGIAMVIFTVVAVRALVNARAELVLGRTLERSGDDGGAIVHYRRAVRWYVPGNPYVVEALDQLDGIARRARAHADPELALRAVRSVRGSLMSARSLYVPHRDRLERADLEISELVAALAADPSGPSPTARRPAPIPRVPRHPLSTACVLIGFGLWVAATFVFAGRGFDEHGRVIRRALRRCVGTFVVGFALFALGLVMP